MFVCFNNCELIVDKYLLPVSEDCFQQVQTLLPVKALSVMFLLK